MSTQEVFETSVTRALVAFNSFRAIGVDPQLALDYWKNAKESGQVITEDDMKQFSASLLSMQPSTPDV